VNPLVSYWMQKAYFTSKHTVWFLFHYLLM
jgi:hypothetical protein